MKKKRDFLHTAAGCFNMALACSEYGCYRQTHRAFHPLSIVIVIVMSVLIGIQC